MTARILSARRLDAAAARMTTLAYVGPRCRRRGVAMIEYVLLIAIAVVLAWILRDQLSVMFKNILAAVKKALGT